MSLERKLSAAETNEIYSKINVQRIKEFKIERESKCMELYFEVDSKQYRLIFDSTGDWFCDIAYEGAYKIKESK